MAAGDNDIHKIDPETGEPVDEPVTIHGVGSGGEWKKTNTGDITPADGEPVSVGQHAATRVGGARFNAQVSHRIFDYLATGWEEVSGNPLIENDTGIGAIVPSIIKWPFDDQYFCYWDDHDKNIKLSLADSIEGPYSEYSGNPVIGEEGDGSWEDHDVSGAEVFYWPWDDSSLDQARLWYHGENGNNDQQTGFAYSTDGKTWTKYSNNPVITVDSSTWRSKHVGYGKYLYADGKSWMFHRGDGNPATVGLSWAEDDGRSFGNYNSDGGGDLPVSPIWTKGQISGTWAESHVLGATPIKVGDTFYAFVSGEDSNGNQRIGLFKSQDIVNWHPHASNPILDTVGTGGWNDGGASTPSFIVVDQTLYMFVNAKDGTGSGQDHSIGAYKLPLGDLEVWT